MPPVQGRAEKNTLRHMSIGTPPPRARQTPVETLADELAKERATALGRMGRALEAAIAELAAFDADHDHEALSPERGQSRASLVAAAGLACGTLPGRPSRRAHPIEG